MSKRHTFSGRGTELSTWDLLKAVAAISMIMDHFGWLFLNNDPLFRIIGRFAAPMYFFLIGYAGKYPLSSRLLYYGLIITAVQSIETGLFTFDILISFLFIRVLFRETEKWLKGQAVLIAIGVVCVLAIPYTINVFAYGTLGIMWAFYGFLAKHRNSARFWWLPVTMICSFISLISVFNPPEGQLYDLAYWGAIFAIGIVMASFEIKVVNYGQPISTIIYKLSRYSLEIYTFHLVGFILLAWFLRYFGVLELSQ